MMAKKEVITPAGFTASATPLSPGIKVGDTVYVSGQVGRHPTTGQMGSDIREQTRNCLERIKAILEAAGTSLGNVVSATCWLSNRENFAAFNEVYASYFPTDKPARATVEANLMAPGALVEIMVTACISN
jgi:2-iminobutanoate/2-iminopropanoate deaminase